MKLRNPLSAVRDLSRFVGPAGLFPLGVLVGITVVERFDDAAFGVLGPEIKHAFHLSNATYLLVATLTSVLPLFLSVPIGYLGDNTHRVRLSRAGAFLWGCTAIATGLAPVLWFLVIARLGGGVGQLVNEPIHASLLADYYEPEALPRVYGGYRVGGQGLGLVAAPAAGLLAAVTNFRFTFVALAVPTFLVVAIMVKMHEPPRGGSLALALPPEERGSMAEGFRRVKAVRTLRRTWVSAVFFGAATIPFDNLLSLFFDQVYKVGPTGRGFITALFGLAGLGGLVLGAKLADRAMAKGRLEDLPLLIGAMGLVNGAGVAAMAIAPTMVLSIVCVMFLSIGLGFLPPYQTMVALVCPPRLRSQGFAWSLMFYGSGALVGGVVIGAIGDAYGQRVALLWLAAGVAFAGLIEMTCRQFVRRDMEQAITFTAASESTALLACAKVDVAYDQVQVLFNVDFEVNEGEIVALLGTNGAGKSTLLKAISGTVDPIGGAVFFNGRDITHADANQTAKLGIAQVPGGRGVFPNLSVAENLRVAGWLFRGEPDYLREATERVLSYFPVLKERWDTQAGSLSGGEQQMLSLSQAFIARPKLLCIDELSLGLAPAIVDRLLEIVRAIHANGTTIVLVEQSVNTALRLAHRAVFMEKGEIRFSGPTVELLARTDILRAVFLKGAAAATNDDTNGNGNGHAPRSDTALLLLEPVVLETRSLTKTYGGVRAVNDVDLTLHAGEILGLIGPNGAGKTTIFDLICGFTPTNSGSVLLHGTDVTTWPSHRRTGLGLGRSFQDARLWPSLTVREALGVGCDRRVEIRSILPALFNLPVLAESEEEVARQVEELIELMSLGAFRDKFISELSTGSRRMVEIAVILAHGPSVLILDEPSSGIAQKETEALGPLLRAVQRHLGCSMLIIEHDMPLVTGLADHLVALDRGSVVTWGVPSDVLHHPAVVESYLGAPEDQLGVGRPAPRRRRTAPPPVVSSPARARIGRS